MLLSGPRIVCRLFVKYLAFTLLVCFGDIAALGFQFHLRRPVAFDAYRYVLVNGVHVKAYVLTTAQYTVSIDSHVLILWLFPAMYTRDWLYRVNVCIFCVPGFRRQCTSPCELQWDLVRGRQETWLHAILWSCALWTETSSSLKCHVDKVNQ